MASISIKLSIWTAVLSILIYVLNANSIDSGVSAGRDKMGLTIQEPNDEDALTDYSPLNQAIYLDKLEKLGALINPKRRIASNMGPFSGYQNHQKRQIRYHQCYFNPISCFRRRK